MEPASDEKTREQYRLRLDLSKVSVCVCYALVLTVGIWRLCEHVDQTYYHGDESGWARASLDVSRMLLAGDFSADSWEQLDSDTFGNLNPQLGKLFLAISAILRWPSGEGLPAAPNIYNFQANYEQNFAEGRVADPEILRTFRSASVAFGVMLAVASMALLHLTSGPFSALIFGVLIFLMPLFVRLSTQIMTDLAYIFLIVVTALAAMWVLAAQSQSRAISRFIVMSIVAALASAVKLPAVILLTPMLSVTALYLWWQALIPARTVPALLAASAAAFGIIGILLNPFLWPGPDALDLAQLQKDWRLLKYGEISEPENPPAWLAEIEEQINAPKHVLSGEAHRRLLREMIHHSRDVLLHESSLHPRNVVPAVYDLTRPLQFPLLYVRWNEYKTRLWRKPTWKIPTAWGATNHLLLSHVLTPLDAILAIGGLVLLTTGAVKELRNRAVPYKSVAVFFVLSISGIILITRLNDQDRYMFPLLLFRLMLLSIFVSEVLQKLFAYTARTKLGERIARRANVLSAPHVLDQHSHI